MEYFPVSSSKITKIGYDKRKELLEVYLKDGNIYVFSQVPHLFYIELMTSPSIGKYFYENIVDSFPFKTYRQEQEPEKGEQELH
jgi:hypothetical protein